MFLAHWVGGYIILEAIRSLYLEPHLDEKYPMSRSKQSRRARRKHPVQAETIVEADQ